MDALVQSVLQSAAEKDAKYRTTEVQKDLELLIDEGNLLAVDPNPLDLKQLRSQKEVYLTELARDNTQLLINKIWELPVERVDDVICVKLPDPNTVVPREKPLPKVKPPTKWEQYARTKGIINRKKSRMVYDETSQEWRPRWGYKRANDDTKDWLIEVPEGKDPYEDQFEKRMKAKKERLAKNELQRLRNIARNMKGKVPGVGLTPTETPDKDHVSRALDLARKSTASLGKFTKELPKEKPAKNMGKKRKFEPTTGDMGHEKKRSLDILNSLRRGRPTLDTTRAANMEIQHQERQRSEANKSGKTGKKTGGKKRSAGGGKKIGAKKMGGKKMGGKGGGKGQGKKGKR